LTIEPKVKIGILDRLFHHSQWDSQIVDRLQSLHRFDRDERIQTTEIDYYRNRVERDRELAGIDDRLQASVDPYIVKSLTIRQQQLFTDEATECDRISSLYRANLDRLQTAELGARLTQIQSEWDRDTWFSKLSRQETELILNRHRHRLLILTAPPKLDRDRQLKLWKNIDFDLEMRSVGDFLYQHYPSHDRSRPVRFYSNYFREPIGDLDAERLHQLLSPIATYILYCDIKPETMTIRIAHWGIQAEEVSFLPPISWNWQIDRAKSIERGHSAAVADRLTIDLAVEIHRFLSAYLIDLYYLGIIPHYQPQLDRAIESLDLPIVQSIDRLNFLRQQQQDKYYRELAELTRQQQQQQVTDTDLLKQQLAIEIQRREEIERQLPPPSTEIDGDISRGTFTSFFVVTTDRRGEIIGETLYRSRCLTIGLGNGIDLELISIPAGEFMMGDRELDTEKPIHQVNISAFSMSKYLITQAQYDAILNERPSYFSGENRPVERVSWWDAMRFCRKLSAKIERAIRLPSEAEWEYACRAYTDTPFYFGEGINLNLVNYHRNIPQTAINNKLKNREQTTNVGTYPPNAFGLYDMHGNVSEWCYDTWHDNYAGAPTDGSAWVTTNIGQEPDAHVLRGGSWYYSERGCRSADRDYYAPDYSSYSIGFRIVLED
jgi:formylglycine-generating enzyme required for sulfatase activity